tara:strand:- start:24927 stop:25781 length:855 start_codon:yes stop_codon:yes gene_type:complete
MITLNEIAYNIKNLAYGGQNSAENNISTAQIKHWIHYHRAKLIADNINKGILNAKNIYQEFILGDFYPIAYTSSDNYFAINAFGISSAKKQMRGSWRNQGFLKIETPSILTLPNDGGIKNLSVNRRVRDMVNMSYSDTGNEIAIYRKSLSERQFGDFNKFTSNDKPYYIMSSYPKSEIKVHGLMDGPINRGDLQTPVAMDIRYSYKPRFRAILQNPTETSIISAIQEFQDDKSPYPIPLEFVSDLVQRIIQVEVQTELKTNKDVVVDGLDDNLRLKASGAQVQR